jgi:hypothetical protein
MNVKHVVKTLKTHSLTESDLRAILARVDDDESAAAAANRKGFKAQVSRLHCELGMTSDAILDATLTIAA